MNDKKLYYVRQIQVHKDISLNLINILKIFFFFFFNIYSLFLNSSVHTNLQNNPINCLHQ